MTERATDSLFDYRAPLAIEYCHILRVRDDAGPRKEGRDDRAKEHDQDRR